MVNADSSSPVVSPDQPTFPYSAREEPMPSI